MILDFSEAQKRKAKKTREPDAWRMIPTLTVFYDEYPDVRVIFRNGWRLINACARPDGKSIVLEG